MNFLALCQYVLMSCLPVLEIFSLFFKEGNQIISISEFASHLGFFIDAMFASFLLRAEFPRMMRPGVYSPAMRGYCFLLFLFSIAYGLAPHIAFPHKTIEIPLIVADSLRAFIPFSMCFFGVYSRYKTKDLHMQPLLFEESHSPLKNSTGIPEKVKTDEENDEFRITRSSSVLTSIADLTSFARDLLDPAKPSTPRSKGFTIEIPKVLISHDSAESIIVLYEIRVSDRQGKMLRTIYRRFSEFESLHNEVLNIYFHYNMLKYIEKNSSKTRLRA